MSSLWNPKPIEGPGRPLNSKPPFPWTQQLPRRLSRPLNTPSKARHHPSRGVSRLESRNLSPAKLLLLSNKVQPTGEAAPPMRGWISLEDSKRGAPVKQALREVLSSHREDQDQSPQWTCRSSTRPLRGGSAKQKKEFRSIRVISVGRSRYGYE